MRRFIYLILSLFSYFGIFAQPTSQTYSTSGVHSFTIPSGYTADLTVQAWGAGGGGGTENSGAKGGGGGGAYASRVFTNVPAGSYSVVVGVGGTPGIAGGASSFSYSSNVIAAGGGSSTGTSGGLGGQAGSSVGSTTMSGVNGSPSSVNDGGAGGTGANGGGSGGAGGLANNGSGGNGIAPGGGGGGKAGPGNGGLSGIGGVGRVIVTVDDFILLPIELFNFNGLIEGKIIRLTWTTASELNNEKFIVEKKSEVGSFRPIVEVKGKGNSIEKQSYQFVDENPFPGLNYYRLKQVDIDGSFEYSQILSINFQRENDIEIFHSPINDKINIRFEKEKNAIIEIFTIDGQLVFSDFNNNSTEFSIDLNGLISGLYLVHVKTENQKETMRFFK